MHRPNFTVLTVIASLALAHSAVCAPDPDAEMLTLRQTVEATPEVDTLGDFVATYSYRSVERDVCYSATDPSKKWTLHKSGTIESARRGEWSSISVTLAVPNPPEVGGNVEEQKYRFFMREGAPAGYSYDRTFTSHPDNWAVINAMPPFTTDLGMAWDGKALMERSQLPQYLNQAYAQAGGMTHSASTRNDGRRIEEFLSAPLPGSPEGVVARVRIARESEASGTLLSAESGRLFTFADGSSKFVPWATLEVGRHLDGLAAGFVVTSFDPNALAGSPLPSTAAGLEQVLAERGPSLVVRQEEYQLQSIRRATTEDKVTPSDFAREIDFVRTTEGGSLSPVWRWDEGAESPTALLAHNSATLEWEPVAAQ